MELIKDLNVVYIEDKFEKEKWEDWNKMNDKNSIKIVGDDMKVKNNKRIKKDVDKKECK